MAAILRLVRGWDRLETENLVTNPSFEASTFDTGWFPNAGFSVVKNLVTDVKYGLHSAKIFPLLANSFFYTDFTSMKGELDGATWSFSAWIKTSASDVRVGMQADNVDIGSAYSSFHTGSGEWERLVTTQVANFDDGGTTTFIYFGAQSGAFSDYHIDGVQLEFGTPTPYCDGTQIGCLWTGAPHASTSTRAATSRTAIDLLDSNSFHLKEVTPMAPEFRGGGTYRSSPFADGRRLVDTKYDNVIETYTLVARSLNQDRMAEITRAIRGILLQATQYWTRSWEDTPVWIEAKADKETNSRYALIINGQIPEDNSHWSQPFMHHVGGSVMDEWDMTIERGFWMSNEPGEGASVPTSAVEPYEAAPIVTKAVSTGVDDGQYEYFIPQYDNSANGCAIGDFFSINRDACVRFQDVNIPKGATITSAKITLTSDGNYTLTTCNVTISGAHPADSSAIASAADFVARTRTATTVAWNGIGSWSTNVTYDTPSLVTIVQEIVDNASYNRHDAMLFFIADNGTSDGAGRQFFSVDQGGGKEAVLEVEFTAPYNRGNVGEDEVRVPSTDADVYIANKRNTANITHIYYYDDSAATWSDNLMGAPLPVALLPDPFDDNDLIYFGVDTSVDDSGPFCSLIFDISDPAGYVTGIPPVTIRWEYWDGAAWSPITNVTDRTEDNWALEYTGASGVFWEQDSDWTANDPGMGVTGYWVRLWIDGTSGSSGAPIQQNKHVYSVVWPYFEVQDSAILGDIAALIKLQINAGSYDVDGFQKSQTSRLVIGSRSVVRGENFTPVINLAQEQNPSGITVAVTSGASFSADIPNAPSGESIALTSSGTHQERFKITIDNSLAYEYRGRFHAFIRATTAAAAAGVGSIALHTRLGTGGVVVVGESGTFLIAAGGGSRAVVDLGIVDFSRLDRRIDEIEIAVHADALTTWDAIDLWLMPVDEWAVDTGAKDRDSLLGFLQDDRVCNVDGITYPKHDIYGLTEGGDFQTEYYSIAATRPQIEPESRVRVYVLHIGATDARGNQNSFMESTLGVKLSAISRYLSLRGDS